MFSSPLARRSAAVVAALSLTAGTATAQQPFPSRPIRIVVGFSAGGGADGLARLVAEGLQRKYGQPVTVDNKPGAGGRISTDAVAKAEPDGYTLGAVVGGDTVIAATDPKLPYRFPADFQPLSTVSVYPFTVITAANGPYKTLPELLAGARTAKLSYASPGPGTTQHLAAEMLAGMAGVDLLHAPYKGTSAALNDVLAGRVTIGIGTISSDKGLVEAGKLISLAVTSGTRSPMLPNVPTVAETLPGFDVSTWMGLVAPGRTPPAIVQQLSSDIQELVRSKEGRERIVALGFEPQASTGAEMRTRVEADIAKWKDVVRTRGISLSN